MKKVGSNPIVSLLTKIIRYKVRGRVVGARNAIEAWTVAKGLWKRVYLVPESTDPPVGAISLMRIMCNGTVTPCLS